MLAALVRILYLLVHPPAAVHVYRVLADSLLHDGSLSIAGHRTTMFEPLYPMLLAAGRLALRRPFLVDLLQIGVASVGAAFLFTLAFTLTRDVQVSTLAAALYAIDPLLVREAVGHSESALFTTLLIAFASAALSAETALGAGAAGVALGLAILARTTAAPLLLLAPATLVARRAPRLGAVLFATATLVVLPLPLRNHAINGSWWPTRSGVNLYIGNSPGTAELLPRDDLDALQIDADRLVHERRPDVDTLPATVAERTIDQLLMAEAWRFMTANPWHTTATKIVNVGYLFSPRIIPYRQDGHERPLVDVIVYGIFSTALIVCAAAGVHARRRRLADDAILWCIALTVVAVNVMYVPATRYRAPMEFVPLFYAAVALGDLSRRAGVSRARLAAVAAMSAFRLRERRQGAVYAEPWCAIGLFCRRRLWRAPFHPLVSR